MVNVIPSGISFDYFFIGTFACFVRLFLYYSELVKERKFKEKVSGLGILLDIISLPTAGLVTVLFQPINVLQAILFGASWDFIFKSYIRQSMVEKDMKVQSTDDKHAK